ncbi:MAG: hypothetical protein ACYDCM_08725 [Candidatus Acidiferrales bacterium]
MATWTEKLGVRGSSASLGGFRFHGIQRQTVISVVLFLLSVLAAWQAAQWISAGQTNMLIFAGMAFVLCAIALAILKSWRMGFYLFIVWLMFEDLIRKYLGNNMAIYFAKDVLAGLTYISLFVAIRRGRAKLFRPPFLLFFTSFFWLAVLQIFNPYSPSVLYGILGMKLQFYYVPLMFVGYALIRDDRDLWRFLIVFMILAGVVSALGIIQAVVGPTFLNPATLAPDIQELGSLEKAVPSSSQAFLLPSSVFVSTGRFAAFLVVATIVGLGAVGYFILSKLRRRKIVLAGIGLIAVAVLLSGSRTAFMYSLISTTALTVAYLWGAPVRGGQGRRLMKAIRRSITFAAIGLAIFVVLFPSAASSRFDFYSQTLSPGSSSYELGFRAWNYPIGELLKAFSDPHWAVGNGTGTASLGGQYVSKLVGPSSNVSVEEGYGQLILEMGILAPFLWILWTAALLWSSWKVVRALKHTRLFPVAIAIFWYAFILLYPLTFLGLDIYENFVNNAFLWILVGILFRLPDFVTAAPAPEIMAAGAVRT